MAFFDKKMAQIDFEWAVTTCHRGNFSKTFFLAGTYEGGSVHFEIGQNLGVSTKILMKSMACFHSSSSTIQLWGFDLKIIVKVQF